METSGWIQFAIYLIALALVTKPMGLYLMHVLDPNGKTWLDPVLAPVERFTYRAMGVDPRKEHDWKQYTLAMLLFSLVGCLFTYAILRPAFVERDGMQLEEEGCLSVPGLQRHRRAARARRASRGSIAHGDEQTIEGTGLLARAFQHEMDHLDGRLFVDRLRGIKRDLIVRQDPEADASRQMVTPSAHRVLRHARVRGADARGAAGVAPSGRRRRHAAGSAARPRSAAPADADA